MTSSTATREPETGPDGARASAEVDSARIAVLAATYQVDVVVPTQFTIETFIDELVAVLAEAVADDALDFTPAQGQWSLARPGQPPMPRWRCLAEHDITDGAVLALTPIESAEVFTPVVEDITDALALINDREFAEFDSGTAAITGLVMLITGAVAMAALLSWSWTNSGSMLWCALPALLLGLLGAGAAVAARTRFHSTRTALGLALAALPLLGCGSAMLVPTPYGEPGPPGAAHLAAAAVVLALSAVALMRLTGVGVAVLTGIATLGILAVAVSFPLALSSLPIPRLLGGVVVAGLVLLTVAPRLAMALARIRPPDLPDPGSAVAPPTLNDLFEVETTRREAGERAPGEDADDDPDRAAIDFETRSRLAVTSLRGVIGAVAVTLTAGAVGSAALSPGGVREIVVALAVAVILAMRARWYPDRVQAIALLAGAAATTVGLAAALVGAYGSAFARAAVVLLLAGAAVAGSVAAARLPGRRLSPVTRRAIDLFEYALIVLVPVLAFWIMGVYTAMRRI